jgi:sugar transferase (PEP-CTERM/EpsH1 system associated)
MNILYLAHRIPYPPNKGDKIRAFRQIERLARNHRVWCACFVDSPGDLQYIDSLSAYCEDVAAVRLNRARAAIRGLGGMIRGGTVTETFHKADTMTAAVHRWTTAVKFDAVVAFSSGMAPYAFLVPAARRVLDLCDLDSRKWLDYSAASRGPARWLYRMEGTRLAAREREWLDVFDATVLITEAEAAALRNTSSQHKLHIVGNGVVLPDVTTGCQNAANPTVGFVGVMDYRPNVDAVQWFVTECWPRIREAHPQAIFRIVGRTPARRVRRLVHVPGVQVVGEVDDVQTELRRFDVSVAPMRIARGLQNKVLEAMAAAKAVVLTRQAAEGISGGDGREYLIADCPGEIASGVSRLLGDEAERHRIGLAARRFVAINHCWERELARFELIVTRGTSPTTERRPALKATGLPKADHPERVLSPVAGSRYHT